MSIYLTFFENNIQKKRGAKTFPWQYIPCNFSKQKK